MCFSDRLELQLLADGHGWSIINILILSPYLHHLCTSILLLHFLTWAFTCCYCAADVCYLSLFAAHIDFSPLLSLSLSAPSEPSNQPQAHALNFLVFTDPWQPIEARGVRMPLLLILSLCCPFLRWQTHLCLFPPHCVFFFNSSHFLRNSRSN